MWVHLIKRYPKFKDDKNPDVIYEVLLNVICKKQKSVPRLKICFNIHALYHSDVGGGYCMVLCIVNGLGQLMHADTRVLGTHFSHLDIEIKYTDSQQTPCLNTKIN